MLVLSDEVTSESGRYSSRISRYIIIMGKEEDNDSERKKDEDYPNKDRNREHKKRRKHEDDDDESFHHKHRKKAKDKEKHQERSGKHKLEVVDNDPQDDIWLERDPTEDGERVRGFWNHNVVILKSA